VPEQQQQQRRRRQRRRQQHSNNNKNQKEKTCTLIDVAISADGNVVRKEAEKK
jgi:hypothetical protein